MKMSSNDGIYKLEDMLYQPEYYAAVRAELYERVFRTNDYQNQKNAPVNFQINGALYSCATKEFILTMIFMRVFIDIMHKSFTTRTTSTNAATGRKSISIA